MVNYCQCGCGGISKNGVYVRGHNVRIFHPQKGMTGASCKNFGLKRSDEVKKKLSELKKGKKQSEEQIKRRAEKMRGHIVTENTRKKISEANSGVNNGMYGKDPWIKGRKMSEEFRKKVSESLHNYYSTHISKKKGIKVSDEVLKKMSETTREAAKDNPNFGMRGKKHSEQARKNISEGHKGQLSWMKGKKHTEETRRIIKKKRLKQIFPSKDTSIELKLNNELIRRGFKEKIDYFRHFPIHDSEYNFIHQVDFIFPEKKLVIECDGIYWHKFDEVKKAHDYVGRDKVVNDFLKSKGYRILRYWEHNIHKNVEEIGLRVVKNLNKTGAL